MFYLLLIAALTSYSLQGNLLVKHARKLDGFQVSMYRGMSLLIIMLPLLFFAPKESYEQLLTINNIGWLCLSGIAGYTAFAASLQASKYLPIGISIALNESGKTALYVLTGILLFHESISSTQGGLIIGLIGGAICLGLQKHSHNEIEVHIKKGLGFLFLSMITAIITITVMSWLSKNIDPFTTGYFWESFIGLGGVLVVLVTTRIQKKPFPRVTWAEYKKIFWSSSPTLLGTGCFTYAMSLGPLSIGGAIMTGGVFVSTLLAWLFYKEKLSLKQGAYILVIIGCIAGLKLVG